MITEEQLKSLKEIANAGTAERFYKGIFANSHRNSRLNKEFEFVKDLNLNNEIILDIGCCGGKDSQLLMNNNMVYSIDTSISSLKYAKSKANEVSLIRASITHLLFKKERFTLVLCIELLHHFNNEMMDASIREISRVIKPDGRFMYE